ncbi:flagellar filament capping protein FliD [Viridibacillus sp. FSL R5-0477]|uniref:Flagellar hook-associated protein 2 n=1 Tax=Viridibacillus arenosi FSL R5-213 TaxID=1227360 RepID=W4F6E0_9BACL|nr:flagellar filament capping protein FliD [Viridibacillus arenosi]ETT87859.1 flagellar hook-associated 2 domain-containing protein [Viridibacillus arenosi FSL R5-213]OMC89871.1 hypothetical protein BK137_15875 [Viridibacillus arenosi]
MVNRVGGLASGMDIDALVEKLMTAERMPLNKLNQKKTTYEWQRDAYRSVNTKLKTFSDYLFDNFSLSSNFVKNKVNVSNSTAVSVTAGSGASGTLNIDKATLATAANKVVITAPPTEKSIATNETTFGELGINSNSTLNLAIKKDGEADNIQSISFDKNTTLKSFIDDLNSKGFNASITNGKLSITAKESGESIEVQGNPDNSVELGKLGFDDTSAGSKLGTSKTLYSNVNNNNTTTNKTTLGELGLTDGTIKLSVINSTGELAPATINYKETDTLESFMKRLNGAGLTAIVSNDGKMSITANSTGHKAGVSIRVDEDNSGVFNKLGFLSGNTGNINSDKPVVNAFYTVNGMEMESTSNTFTQSGYTVTLNQNFSGSTVSISADKDLDSMVDKVKEFVTKYNELITDLNDHLKETKYRDYTPLTAEQRKDMTESEQKLWDEKAMSGLLRGDSILRNGLGDMRNALYSQVKGLGLGNNVIDTMFKMGITTSSNFNDGGKLVIDETKLRKALEEDPDRVVKTLTQNGSKTDSEGDTRGIVQRLRDSMSDFTKNIEKKAGRATMTDNQFAIGKNLIDTNKRITTLTDRLKDVEARYWKQFTAMETAINKANSQSSIFAQFGGQ